MWSNIFFVTTSWNQNLKTALASTRSSFTLIKHFAFPPLACALPPDYAKPNQTEEDMFEKGEGVLGPYNPMPINTSQVQLTNEMNTLIQKFSEQYHDTWAQKKQVSPFFISRVFF